MDLTEMSKQFQTFRESPDWKELETALERLLNSPACAAFNRSVAPANRMEAHDLLRLLAGFVREADRATDSLEEKVGFACKDIYEYDDGRPTMTLTETSTDCTILIGDKSYQDKVQLFELERGTVKLRFGRAKLPGVSRLNELTDPARPTVHRLLVEQRRIPVRILFFNVVTETEKYTGDQTTFADFYVLGRD